MILKSFRVTEFRSVQDSGWIDVEDITALIGTNESGKTNLLLPLWKLNPADEGKIDLQEDLPRDKFHALRDAKIKPVFIRAKYILTDQEKKELATISGHTKDEFAEVIIAKTYDNQVFWDFPCEITSGSSIKDSAAETLSEHIAVLESAKATSKAETERQNRAKELLAAGMTTLDAEPDLAAAIKRVISDLHDPEEVKTSIACSIKLETVQQMGELLEQLQKPSLSDIKEVTEYLCKQMPRYVYYSNYGNLDSRIYLPRVVQNLDQKDLGVKEAAKARTLKTLFKFVNLDPKEIRDLGTESGGSPNPDEIETMDKKKKEREILLASASASFTKSFNEWWKQGNYTFEFQADGNFFRIWVSDSIRPERIELESRSTGLQWFFSFYLVFLVESELHHQNAILLLDEPGVTLHPLAQKDLFLFFENLAQSNQMIYTTHSPFMVDSNHLERVRSVYIDKQGKTVASPDLRASERLQGNNQSQSIYPAHAALGLTVSDMLLINCNPVLVEGESDQLYLSALKSLLISKGCISPLKEIVFIPTGGVKGIKATVGILAGAKDKNPVVIVDGDKPGKKLETELKTDLYAAEPDRVVNISEFTSIESGEIEDIFPKEKFAKVVATFLPRLEDEEDDFDDDVSADTPMCDQIESFAKEHGISLEKGWKVKLAANVKRDILKGKDKVICEDDPEFSKVVELFKRLY